MATQCTTECITVNMGNVRATGSTSKKRPTSSSGAESDLTTSLEETCPSPHPTTDKDVFLFNMSVNVTQETSQSTSHHFIKPQLLIKSN